MEILLPVPVPVKLVQLDVESVARPEYQTTVVNVLKDGLGQQQQILVSRLLVMLTHIIP